MKFLNLLKNEYIRVFNNYKLMVVILLTFIGNALLLFFYMNDGGVSHTEYRDLKNVIAENDETAINTLYDIYDNGQQTGAVEQLIGECITAEEYEAYLQKIQDEAKNNSQISIFTRSEFAKSNILKTAEDFAKLRDRKVECIGSYGLSLAMSFGGTDIVLVMVIVLLVAVVLLEDKKNGIMPMLHAAEYGSDSLAMAKIIVVSTMTFLVGIIMEALNIALALYMYGNVDFSATIQSVVGFNKCSYMLSVGEGIIVSVLISGFTYAFLSFIILMLGVLSENYVLYYMCTAGFVVLEYVLFYLGKKYAWFQLAGKYNVMTMLNPIEFLSYYNYNIFSTPRHMLFVNLILMFILMLVFTGISVFAFSHSSLDFRLIQPATKKGGKRIGKGLLGNETYKLLAGNRVIILLVALVLLQVNAYYDKHAGGNADEKYYRSYMENIVGDVTQEKYDYIEELELYFAELNAQFNEYDRQYKNGEITLEEFNMYVAPVNQELQKQNGFLRAKEYVEYIKNLDDENKGFVYDTGWNILAGSVTFRNDIMNGILLTMFIVLALAPVMAQEERYQMNRLIDISYKKRKLYLSKLFLSFLMVSFVYLVVYLPELFWVSQNYEILGTEYSVSSLMILSNVNLNCTIGGYFIIVYMVRIVTAIVIGMVTVIVGKFIKNTNYNIIACVVIFSMPLLIKIMGIDIIDSFSLNKLISGNMLFR